MRIVGLSRFCAFFCVTFLLQDEPKLPPDEKGLDRSRSRRTCSRSGRSARRAGPNATGELVILSKHTIYKRFHFSLCQRNYEQVRLVHEIVIAVPVPQIQEQIVEVMNDFLNAVLFRSF